MTLTKEQQVKVKNNLGLVGKVIRDKVHNTNQYFDNCCVELKFNDGSMIAGVEGRFLSAGRRQDRRDLGLFLRSLPEPQALSHHLRTGRTGGQGAGRCQDRHGIHAVKGGYYD